MSTVAGYWDRQFQFSNVLPDFDMRLKLMDERSATVSEAVEFQRIFYGDHPRQWLDQSGEEHDLLMPVFVHGGYWRALDAESHRFVTPGIARIGSRQAQIEYRLMPSARLNDLVDDVAAALIRIAQTTDARLVVIGHSAGGHLAVAATRRAALADKVAAIVPISGIFDLEPIRWSFLQAEIQLTSAEVLTSPLRQSPAEDPPMLIAVGALETEEFLRQSEALSAVTGVPVLYIGGAHHMTVLDALATPDAPLTEAIVNFVNRREIPSITTEISS
jgi:arylformamidase